MELHSIQETCALILIKGDSSSYWVFSHRKSWLEEREVLNRRIEECQTNNQLVSQKLAGNKTEMKKVCILAQAKNSPTCLFTTASKTLQERGPHPAAEYRPGECQDGGDENKERS